MIPYADFILIAVVWLSARHYYSLAPSGRSKRLVLYVVGTSILAGFLLPSILRLPAALFQVVVCAYLVVYHTASTTDGESAESVKPQPVGPGNRALTSGSDEWRV
jgi:hypothetical protein